MATLSYLARDILATRLDRLEKKLLATENAMNKRYSDKKEKNERLHKKILFQIEILKQTIKNIT